MTPDIASRADDTVPPAMTTAPAPVLPPLPPARQEVPPWWIWLGAFVLAAAAALAYSNAYTVPFIFDDEGSIIMNESIRSWRTVLFPPGDTGDTVGGRPLLNVTLAINYFFGETKHVWGYHLVNVLIHITAGLALFGLVRRTLAGWGATGLRWGGRDAFFCALAAAALWMLHPMQTQSVTYIVQRAESLMSMLYLLTLYCFARAMGARNCGLRIADCGLTDARGGLNKSEMRWLAASVVFCALGMASKEVMVSAPALVFLYDRAFVAGSFKAAWLARWRYYAVLCATWVVLATSLQGGSFGFIGTLSWVALLGALAAAAWVMLFAPPRIRGYGALFFVALCAAWLVLAVCLDSGFRGGTTGYGTPVKWWMYAITQCKAIIIYLKLAFWPDPLVFDYGVFFIISTSLVWWHMTIVLTLVAAALFAMFRWPRAGILGAWFFAVLAPSSSFIPVVSQTMSEHRMYMPLAAIVIAVVVVCYWFVRKGPGFAFCGLGTDHEKQNPTPLTWAAAAICVSIAVMFGALAWKRNEVYQSVVSIWEDTVKKAPQSHRAQNNMGCALIDDKQYEKGIPYCMRAVQLKPDYGEAFGNIGYGLSGLKRFPEAIPYYRQALFHMRKIGLTNLDRVLLNFGLALHEVGLQTEARQAPAEARALFDEARAAFAEAVSINPKNAASLNNLGNYEFLAQRYAEAKKFYQRAVEADPEFAEAWYDLGNAAVAIGQAQGADGRVDEAVLRAALEEAERYYRKAIQFSPGLVVALDNLGRVLLMLNRFAEAAECYEKALKEKPDPEPMTQLFAARAFMQVGKNAAAIPLLENLSRMDPANIEIMAMLASARGTGPFVQANPGVVAQLNEARALMQSAQPGKTVEAVPLLEAVLKGDPGNIEAAYLLGNARVRLGDTEGAMAAYRHAIRINPSAVEPHGNLGSLLASAGRWDEAISELSIALQLKPEYAEAHNNLANALAHLGRDPDARKHYEEAVRLKPEMAQARYNYARLLARLGEIEAARKHAQEALRLRPDYADAAEFLKALPPAPVTPPS